MPVADVLLISAAPLLFDFQTKETEPPLSKALEVAPGVHLAGVKPDIATAVLHATKFRELEHGGTSAMYGFVRYDPPGDSWDEDQAISKTLFLSHFVHAHEGGFEFTARIETDERDRLVRLEPADVAPAFTRAYCCLGARRKWLTQADGLRLQELVAAYDAVLPSLAETRVGLAVSLFFESPFVFHGRPRALLLTTTLEGLVSTSTERAVKQFTTRVPALANEVGLSALDAAWAERIYGFRSKLAHGSALLQSVNERERQTKLDDVNANLTDLDELLRRVLRKALTDADFRERVENVDKYWPVTGKGCPACRSRDSELLVVTCPRCNTGWQ
jgi:hypothetical protein